VGNYVISGIQQAGIGVTDVRGAFRWYNEMLGMDIPVFEEAAVADLMLPYTGGSPHSRHAILAINLRGGGGFEIWQYTSRTPQPASFSPQLGDLGLFCCKIKSSDVRATYERFLSAKTPTLGGIVSDPAGNKCFFFQDPYGNHFQVVEHLESFASVKKETGGCVGMIIGVTDIEKSKRFYGSLLGYDKVIFEGEGDEDLKALPGGDRAFRRCILTHKLPRKGPFSRLLGQSFIELVAAKGYEPKEIFGDRYWGDLGFIHLCFDIRNMASLKKAAQSMGHPFTVDGGAGFEMGDAAGHFSYVEDPDGALIEFVETRKVPILKKLNWFLDLSKRNPEKPLPDWMLKALRFNRKKP
jgi:catechol 2,3-dioxygenase-like lactoylglutathione lyase family enzyme